MLQVNIEFCLHLHNYLCKISKRKTTLPSSRDGNGILFCDCEDEHFHQRTALCSQSQKRYSGQRVKSSEETKSWCS